MLEDYLIKDTRTARAHAVPKTRKGAKLARLRFEALAYTKDIDRVLTLVRVRLETGRFHQIRIQFSSRKMPLLGDGKYGSRTNKCAIALYAYRLTFPEKRGERTVCAWPELETYPWNLFDKEIFLNV